MSTPVVPMSAFRSLAGDELGGQIDELVTRKECSELVLFSDPSGAQMALVSVGQGRRFAALADVAGVEIDGLRALCAARAREAERGGGRADGRDKELAQLEESLNARERYVAECELRIAEVGQTLSEREAMIEQREQQLLSKERDFFRRGGEVSRQAGEAGTERDE